MKTSLVLLLLLLLFAVPVRADLPRIPSTEEIRKMLEERSPLPEFSLELFDAMLAPRTQVVDQIGEEGNRPNALIRVDPTGFHTVLTTQRDAVGSTGVRSVDNAVQKMMARASRMAAQAVMYDSLRSFQDGSLPIPTFDAIEPFFRKMGTKESDEGVFYKLNRDFLIELALIQYAAEVEIMVSGTLRLNMEPNSGKHNVEGFREAISEVPVSGRQIVWSAAEKMEETRRRFYGVQEDVRNAIAVKYLPLYIDTFAPEEYAYVLGLVKGKLRDMQVSLPIVNWCLDNARNAQEILDLAENELEDATYIRFRSKNYMHGKGDPFAEPKYENYPNQKIKVPEEMFFTQVFRAIIIKANLKFNVTRQELILLLANRQVRARYVNASYRLETLLRHIELMLSEEPTDSVAEWEPILVGLKKLILKEADQEASRLHVARENFSAKFQYLREEVEIRRRGWFPPTQTTFVDIVNLLHTDIWREEGRLQGPREAALTLAAARRALTEISHQVLGVMTEQIEEPGSKFLRSGRRAAYISACLSGIVHAALEWPEDEPEEPMEEEPAATTG